MKKKIPKILGVALAFLLVVSLMAFGAPVAAADYEENDWGEWGLPSVDPDTDVGPIAVAPDGTLYAAVGPTSFDLTLEAGDPGTAEFSTDEAHSGSYSVELHADEDGHYGKVVMPLEMDFADLDDFSVWVETAGEEEALPLLEIEFDEATLPTDVDLSGGNNHPGGVSVDLSSYTRVNISSQPGQSEGISPTLMSDDDETWELYGTHSGADIDVGTGAYWTICCFEPPWFYDYFTWDEIQTIFAGATVEAVQVDLSWPQDDAGNVASTVYVDDITINGLTYDLEDDAILTDDYGEALLPFGSVLAKSEDDGYSWDDTELDPATSPIVDIAISPNYEEDETVYVGCLDGTVYRLEDAGEGDVIAIKDIVDSEGVTATQLFSIDVWTDEDDYNWILVGTDLDVMVLKDKRFEDWRDQELATGGTTWKAYEVAFAPDFEASDLIWAVIDDDDSAGTPDDFMVTATASPGKWGQDIGEVDLDIDATRFADIGFPDDYDSDPDTGDTNLWVAVTEGNLNDLVYGDIFLIEGVDADDGDSNAIEMFTDIGGEDPADFISIAVSGDYGDEIILAGELNSPTVWISDDGGYGWDAVDKSPTGEGMTYVIMEADVVWDGDVFDPDDGMAFACTVGDESAVSRSNDGGLVFNQVGLIDTELDTILDLGFHPDFPDTATYMMLTDDGADAYSVWLTENGDEDEPDYMRVLCGYDGAPGNLDAESLSLVEYAQDADAIYIYGEDETSDPSIWKSTDDGQTFGKKRSVDDNAVISDWVITEDDTIYAAASDDGFYMTTNSGLSWTSVAVGTMNDICLSPDFENDETILLGGDGGEVFMSDDAGGSFDDTTDTGLSGNVYVAFDADYADEDADGYTLIYAVGDGIADAAVMVGEVADTDDVDWDALEDDTNEEPVTGDFFGLAVSDDNALYAIADNADYDSNGDNDYTDDGDWTDVIGVARLLLDESDSLWETASDTTLTNPRGLWLTPGSNVLWTIDGDELWVLEDTLSGQVTLDAPKNGYQSDLLWTIGIAWDEMRGADEYEWSLDETSGLGLDEDGTTDDTDVNVSVMASSEYDWKVRVATGEPWHSRWSDEWTFNSALGDAPWAPTLYTPGGEWQYSGLDVELMPAFSWESAKNADGYQFVLADNAEFTSPLVNDKVPESAYNLDFELEYNANYFWRVMAYDGNKAISRWSDIGAFTTIEKPGAPPPSPAPPATVTQPAPAPVVIPTPIPPVLLWVIVGIGAALIIAVIILIIRTRRAV